ncbi:MAG: 16S rRNA (cytosine(1402)-N(4))-methyltransferase RsmH [Alphaproteobacteria bacterium]|nr:16S rRNA (cytosine(1402)-N(4))-methyltransferase RsmH [Alphaproteobacteria bacterium]
MSAVAHIPVLLDEVVAALEPRAGGLYVDGTFGGGGYARAILGHRQTSVLGIDRDADALAAGEALASAYKGRLTLVHGRFGEMEELVPPLARRPVDGICLDLGVSSMQLDRPERGFSFQSDGPLDMRMDAASGETTAADIVNSWPLEELERLLRELGEEPKARAIARAIVRIRSETPITRTAELARIVREASGPAAAAMRIHPATRTFQALRIAVNGELDELEAGLLAAERLLAPGGRLAVVAFHSLEDRIVKQFLTHRSGKAPNPSRHLPPTESEPATFRLFGRAAVKPSEEEMARNPRARSARLRAAERTHAAPRGRTRAKGELSS